MSKSTIARRIFVGTLLLVAACAAGTAERRSVAEDPTSPHAEEAPVPPAPNLLEDGLSIGAPPASGPDGGTGGTMRHGHHGSTPSRPPPEETAPSGTFTCRMHPEVRSGKPGSCPKCGMQLEPVAPADGGAAP